MVAAAVFCSMFGIVLIIGGIGYLVDGTRDNVVGGWLSGLGIILVVIALILAAAIAHHNVGAPRTSLAHEVFPGNKYEVVEVICVAADRVELIVLEDGEREYVSLPRDRVLNKEIPEDVTVLRVLRAKKDYKAVYIFGELPYADHDFFKR